MIFEQISMNMCVLHLKSGYYNLIKLSVLSMRRLDKDVLEERDKRQMQKLMFVELLLVRLSR